MLAFKSISLIYHRYMKRSYKERRRTLRDPTRVARTTCSTRTPLLLLSPPPHVHPQPQRTAAAMDAREQRARHCVYHHPGAAATRSATPCRRTLPQRGHVAFLLQFCPAAHTHTHSSPLARLLARSRSLPPSLPNTYAHIHLSQEANGLGGSRRA